MTAINNLLVVRFSLRNPDWELRAYAEESNRSRWFNFRFEIFQNFLLASLKDGVTPKKLYLLMDFSDFLLYENFKLHVPSYVVSIFSVDNDHYDQVARDIISLHYKNVAISRVDSDDCLAPCYLDSINNCIEDALSQGANVKYVVAPIGVRATNCSFQIINYPNGPFLTLFAIDYSDENIYGINHENVCDYPHITCSSAHWLQTINGTNVSNDLLDSQLSYEKFFKRIESDSGFFATEIIFFDDPLPFGLEKCLPLLTCLSDF